MASAFDRLEEKYGAVYDANALLDARVTTLRSIIVELLKYAAHDGDVGDCMGDPCKCGLAELEVRALKEQG